MPHSKIGKRFPPPNVFAFDQKQTKSSSEKEMKNAKEVPEVGTATALVSWCHANHDELQLEPR